MAKGNTRGTSAQPTAKGEAALPASTRAALDELAAWAALSPPLSALDRETFAARFPDAYCERLGQTTRSRGTVKDALAWLRLLHPAKRSSRLGVTGVSPLTLALFIDATRALLQLVESQGARAVNDGIVRREASRAEAVRRYRDLRDRVDDALGRNDDWIAALRMHTDSELHGEFDPDTARSLRLADGLDAWLRGKDRVIAHALASEGVTAEAVKAMRDAADALEAARADATRPTDRGLDTPAINRAEGRVLALMQRVYRDVNAARAKGATTAVLPVGAATKRLIAPSKKPKAKSTNGASEKQAAPAP